MSSSGEHAEEVRRGDRFKFGENWWRFLSVLNDDRIAAAQASLQGLLGLQRLDGKTFLDVGSGSGLFSLVAVRLGAAVTSFDFDPKSVECAIELRRRYSVDEGRWQIRQGSVLDEAFMRELPRADVVYSWGVLHHTGQMWPAIENAAACVNQGGLLAIALYNDQGIRSRVWRRVKRAYCSGMLGKVAMSVVFFPLFALAQLVVDLSSGRSPLSSYRTYHQSARGMSVVHDWVDWLGGYPFEVAGPGEVFQFMKDRGFRLERMNTTSSPGCNEFVFRREA
jgi:2-polyprenyl-6-hydroxyphenyl methylase/3-demethylubiquinone-9 3-methyltransferase